MSFSHKACKYSYKDRDRQPVSSSLNFSNPLKLSLKDLPKIKHRSKRAYRSSNSSFEGSIKLDKSSYQYSCVKKGQQELIRVSNQITGSLSFIRVENSNGEKTPRSFERNMKKLINSSQHKSNLTTSIVFRKKKWPRITNHSYSDKFFNKIKRKIGTTGYHCKHKKTYSHGGKSSGYGLPFRNIKKRKKKTKCKKGKTIKKRNKTQREDKLKIPFHVEPVVKKKADILLPIILKSKDVGEETDQENNNSTTDSVKKHTFKPSRGLGMFSQKAEKVMAKKIKRGLEQQNDFLFSDEETNSKTDRLDQNLNNGGKSVKNKKPLRLMLPIQSTTYPDDMRIFKSRPRHKPSKSCLANSGFVMPKSQLNKPKTMVKVVTLFLPLDTIEKEDERIFDAVKFYKNNLIAASTHQYFKPKTQSLNNQIKWKLTDEQLQREGITRKKKRGSPSAKSRRNQLTEKQKQVIDSQIQEDNLELSKEVVVSNNDGKSVNLLSIPINQKEELPSIRRRNKSSGFTGGFGSMV